METLAQAQGGPIFILPQGQFTPLSEVTLSGLVNAAVNISLVIASLLFLFSFLIGGIKVILSGGNKEKMDIAKRQLINALLGIAIVFSTWAILSFVSTFFGIELLTFEIPSFL